MTLHEIMDINVHSKDPIDASKKIKERMMEDEIKMLEDINKIAEEREFNNVAYFNLIYRKVEILKETLKMIKYES